MLCPLPKPIEMTRLTIRDTANNESRANHQGVVPFKNHLLSLDRGLSIYAGRADGDVSVYEPLPPNT